MSGPSLWIIHRISSVLMDRLMPSCPNKANDRNITSCHARNIELQNLGAETDI